MRDQERDCQDGLFLFCDVVANPLFPHYNTYGYPPFYVGEKDD